MILRQARQNTLPTATRGRVVTKSPLTAPRAERGRRAISEDWSLVRRALALAVGSLLLAGCFSLLLIVGRMPVFSEWVSDPLFFKRCLVLHVDLALVVWFFSFAAGLFALIPGDRSSPTASRPAFSISLARVSDMIGRTLLPTPSRVPAR